MCAHVCPWWGGYFIDNRLRRWLHNPERILAPYVEPGMTAMDVGCGMGMFAITMAKLVGKDGRVIAVDLQQKMLDVLLKRAATAGVAERIRTHNCTPDSLGLDEPIDFALAFYSAHEVPDLRRLLSEILGMVQKGVGHRCRNGPKGAAHNGARHLFEPGCFRPAGRLLVVEPIGHVTARGFEHMLSLAEGIGFKIQERPQVRLSRAALLVPRREG